MIIVAVGLLGLVLGSFVNALVWRLHEQEELQETAARKSQKVSSKKLRELSVARGRSMCPDCHHVLAAKDLVPVVSWLGLRGKCRYCRKPISWQYPLVELATAVLFVVSYLHWPAGLHTTAGVVQLGFWLLFVVLFTALAVYDARWFLLPDRIVYPLIVLAAAQVLLVTALNHTWATAWQPVLAAAILSGLFLGLFMVSKGQWIGFGDVKLAVVLGLLAGSALQVFLLLFLASFVGMVASLPLLVRGKGGLKTHIPFGPCLLLATYIVVLFGPGIVQTYTRLFLPTY